MSWLGALAGRPLDPGPPRDASRQSAETGQDSSAADRLASAKPANRPFLVYKEYRAQQEALHKEWLERKKEYDAKVARGEKVEPLGPDPTAVEEVGFISLLKFFLYAAILVLLAGKFFTGDFLWDYRGKWISLKAYMPTNDRLFSERLLATYDGSVPGMPIYLAIDSIVYDVSSNPHTYGPGGSYNMMAGVDAARAFATGCFQTHRTHDTRGLSESEQKGLEHWKKFFAEHKTYVRVGRVLHQPIDPASPIPPPCDHSGRDDADPKKVTKENTNRRVGPKQEHEEL